MNFFASEAFLSSLAHACAPDRPFRVGLHRTQGRLFRLVSVDGGAPITQWPFFDSVAAVEETPSGPVGELRYLPMVAQDATEITEVPESVQEGPESFPAPYIDWTRFPTWKAFEAHFAARRSSLPRDSRQKRRNLEREVGTLTFIAHDPRPEVFDQCLAWKSAQYVRTGLTDLFRDSRNVELFRTLTARGALLISSLSAGPTLLAVHFGGLADEGLYSWVAAYDPAFGRYSPGRLLLEDILRHCQERGHREFDFGIGHSSYKWHYASHSRTLGPLGRPPMSLVVRRSAKAAAKSLLLRWPSLYARVQRMRQNLRARGVAPQD